MKDKSKFRLIIAQVTVLLIALSLYILARSYFLYHVHLQTLERVFGIFFFAAELFIMFHAFGFFLDIINQNRHLVEPRGVEPGEDATVAILIPSRHEPKKVVYNTLLTCQRLSYLNKKLYLLDDSSIESYKQEARELAESFGVELFTRKTNRGAKAGLINDVMAGLNEKYIAVFDADQNPMPGFLSMIIPILEGDERLALVQTPQFYTNTDVSHVAMVANVQQAVFFEYVCEGKASNESMFCCGTNVVIRSTALRDVGGFDESTLTEDVATTLRLHRKKWKTLYYNKAYTFGMAPEDIGAYFKQQARWATGNVQLLRKLFVLFFTQIRALSPVQWFEYLITATYYFIGWAYLFLMTGPILYIFFGFPSYFMDRSVYLLTFVPYFLLSLTVYYSSMKKKKYTRLNVFKAQMLALLTIPIYIRASLQGLFNLKKVFNVTPKGGIINSTVLSVWPQLLLWMIHLSALTWGLLKLCQDPSISLGMNVFWVGFHFFMFCGIFYFNWE